MVENSSVILFQSHYPESQLLPVFLGLNFALEHSEKDAGFPYTVLAEVCSVLHSARIVAVIQHLLPVKKRVLRVIRSVKK